MYKAILIIVHRSQYPSGDDPALSKSNERYIYGELWMASYTIHIHAHLLWFDVYTLRDKCMRKVWLEVVTEYFTRSTVCDAWLYVWYTVNYVWRVVGRLHSTRHRHIWCMCPGSRLLHNIHLTHRHTCMCDARLDLGVQLTRLHITRHMHIWFKQNLFHMWPYINNRTVGTCNRQNYLYKYGPKLTQMTSQTASLWTRKRT